MQVSNYIVTGGIGFIGAHLVIQLLEQGNRVTVIDNFDPFYSKELKLINKNKFDACKNFTFLEGDIRDFNFLQNNLNETYDAIIHLAAKAGVRPSMLKPQEYSEVNVYGTLNLLEFAKSKKITQFVFASSSSVYGVNPNYPWQEEDQVLLPISPYASSKVSAELLGHVYSHLYQIRFIALRFFTVYGPGQRPDLAIHKFSKMMLEHLPIPVYGDGSTKRDYTYVGDIVDGIIKAIDYKDSIYEVINLGNNRTVTLLEMIETLETAFNTKATKEWLPEQPGDVPLTFADISKAQKLLNYNPTTTFEQGIGLFKNWFSEVYANAAATS